MKEVLKVLKAFEDGFEGRKTLSIPVSTRFCRFWRFCRLGRICIKIFFNPFLSFFSFTFTQDPAFKTFKTFKTPPRLTFRTITVLQNSLQNPFKTLPGLTFRTKNNTQL